MDIDLNQFDLHRIDGMVMPESALCENCGKVYKYSPFTVLSYVYKQKVVEKLCDECIYLIEVESRVTSKQLKKNIIEKDKAQRRMAKLRYARKMEKKEQTENMKD